MKNQLCQPKAVALHTAFKAQDKDYNWYIHGGESLTLEEDMKAAHYALIRDRKGEAPRIIVIVQAERIGLLVGTMRSERRDYVNGAIYDTLYLEFDEGDRQAVLASAATLLAAYDRDEKHQEYQQYEQFFLNYAEALAEQGENANIFTPPTIDLPICEGISADNCDFQYPEIAVFSNLGSREKCARYLECLSEQEKISTPIRIVSTGRIGKDDLKKYADAYTKGTLLILTLSSTVEGEIDLSSLRDKISNIFRTGLNAFPGNPLRNKPSSSPNQKQDEPAADNLQQSSKKDSDVPLEKELISKEDQSKPGKKQADLNKTGAVGTLILLVVGSLFLATLDRVPPQLVSLTLPLAASAAIAVPFGEAAKPDVFTIPRFGKQGALRLTFDENRAMSAETPPQLSISEGEQAISFTQPCTSSDEEAKVWSCPLALTSEDPNRVDSVTLILSDVKDQAGNLMEPKTLSFPLHIESAEIQGAFNGTLRILRKEELPFVMAQVTASAKYGVESVTIGGAEAAFGPQDELWRAEIPLQNVLDTGKPLNAIVRDTYGNELVFSL